MINKEFKIPTLVRNNEETIMTEAKKFLEALARSLHEDAEKDPCSEGGNLSRRKANIATHVARFINETAILSDEQAFAVKEELDRLLRHAFREQYNQEEKGIIALATLINTFN